MPKGPILIATCPVARGAGGLGQHLAKVESDSVREGFEVRLSCQGGGDPALAVGGGWEGKVFRFPPFRWNASWRVFLRHEIFDMAAARRLQPCDTVVAFMGAGLRTFRRAREIGVRRLVLEMPNSHPHNVRRLHGMARAMHPLERTWMGSRFAAKAVREMAMADEIRTNSDYTLASVAERGVDPGKLARRHLGWAPRFDGLERRPPSDGRRTVVYVGSFTVFKGVPFLVDRFRNLVGEDLRLLLVGGWTDRGMRLWLEEARRRDPRIEWTSGDPAPHLATADLLAHPSWEDGWGYAAAEAFAAGVPLVVSDQVGMKELVSRRPFDILPAGDAAAWDARLGRWAAGAAPAGRLP